MTNKALRAEAAAESQQRSASRAILFFGLMLIAGCAPVLVVPSLHPKEFWLLILAYFALAGLACAIVQAVRAMGPGGTKIMGIDAESRRWLLAAMIITGLTLSHFQVFKQLVLPSRGFPFDQMIADWEFALLGGRDAWEVTHAIFGSLVPTLVLDVAYAVWLPIMFLFPAATVVAVRDRQTRLRLLGTWVASWIVIGSIAAWALGSAGPCYYNALVGPREGFVRLHEALTILDGNAARFGLSVHALYFQDMLFDTQGGGLVFASGISAMPSMHVAMATLFAVAGFKRSSSLGWAFSVYAVLIWIASIHLGWHYAADGLLGSIMMLALWGLSGPTLRFVQANRAASRRASAAFSG